VGPIQIRHYAPDWIWQDRAVNLLLVLRSEARAPRRVEVTLDLPAGVFFQPPREETLVRNVDLQPGETRRIAFANILALSFRPSTGEPLPRGVHEFALRARSGGESAREGVRVRTIRGAMVRGNVWCIVVPAAICFLWSIGLLALLSRKSPAGAWRRVREVIPDRRDADPPPGDGR
jgi:hypothetical protein